MIFCPINYLTRGESSIDKFIYRVTFFVRLPRRDLARCRDFCHSANAIFVSKLLTNDVMRQFSPPLSLNFAKYRLIWPRTLASWARFDVDIGFAKFINLGLNFSPNFFLETILYAVKSIFRELIMYTNKRNESDLKKLW